MTIEPATVEKAFDAFHSRYVVHAVRSWNLDHHAELWAKAQRALANSEPALFIEVYDELRRRWQLARGKDATLAPPDEIFKTLCALPLSLRQARLSAQTELAAADLLFAVEALACVKQVKGSQSIMATSKILHFFNPRLFVIVDRGMVWNWALNHLWLWNPIAEVRDMLQLAQG